LNYLGFILLFRRLVTAHQLVEGLLGGAATAAAGPVTPLPVLAHYVRTMLDWVQTVLLKQHAASGASGNGSKEQQVCCHGAGKGPAQQPH
jgi:hypothetical protein